VTNLKAHNRDVSVGKILSAIGHEFLQTDIDGVDCGKAFAQKQRGFQLLNPTDDWFPGLGDIKVHLQSWEWTSGKTPEFIVKRSLSGTCEVELKVVKGIVLPATVNFQLDSNPEQQNQFLSFIATFEGKPFSPQLLHALDEWAMSRSYEIYQ
jgi:lipoyltransferase 1